MESLSLYVHWPFCLSKCPYCDFNSHVRENVDQDRWRTGLLAEIEYYANTLAPHPIDTLFFGGGTPSLMPPETVAAVIEAARDAWGFTENVEISLEANPTSVEAENFAKLADAGVNRVSLGIQALKDDDLAFLGRAHSVAEALQALDVASNCFDRVSFDLIYGRQGQKLAAWETELREAISFSTEHLSLYQLTIEPNTGFAGRVQRGEITMPTDDLQADLFLATEEITGAQGLVPYEISNFARPGAECRHNLNYWRSGSWIGIGPGAHGRITVDARRVATANSKRPETWLDEIEAGQVSMDDRHVLAASEIASETVMMGLRLAEGVSLAELERRTGLGRTETFNWKRVQSLAEEGFIGLAEDRLFVESKGRLVLNAILGSILA